MTIEETRQKILTDDAFVLEEMERVRYLYGLKKEIRYAQDRHNEIDTESVAEHIYGMHVIANYFLPLEDPEGKLDKLKILEMITWHDMEEIETGDTISHLKTEIHHKEAEIGLEIALSKIPEHLRDDVTVLMTEYEAHESPEARFTKAIDKAEPMFEVWDESYKKILHKNGNTRTNHWETKEKHIRDFPYIYRFLNVGTDRLESKGFFLPENP